MEDRESLILSIRKKLRRGYPRGEIVSELIQKGYAQDEVNSIMNEVADLRNGNSDSDKKKSTNSLFNLVGSCCLITGLALKSLSGYYPLLANILLLIGSFFLVPSLISFIREQFKRI